MGFETRKELLEENKILFIVGISGVIIGICGIIFGFYNLFHVDKGVLNITSIECNNCSYEDRVEIQGLECIQEEDYVCRKESKYLDCDSFEGNYVCQSESKYFICDSFGREINCEERRKVNGF